MFSFLLVFLLFYDVYALTTAKISNIFGTAVVFCFFYTLFAYLMQEFIVLPVALSSVFR